MLGVRHPVSAQGPVTTGREVGCGCSSDSQAVISRSSCRAAYRGFFGCVVASMALGVATFAHPALAATHNQESPTTTTATSGSSTSPSFLFVQSAKRGTFARAGREDEYRLTLRGVDDSTLWFTDRPDRITGVTDHKAALDALFTPDLAPPNAVVVLTHGKRDADRLAVTLGSPKYDARLGELEYTAKPLEHTATEQLTAFEADLDPMIPKKFGAVSLFIDSADPFKPGCEINIINQTNLTLTFVDGQAQPALFSYGDQVKPNSRTNTGLRDGYCTGWGKFTFPGGSASGSYSNPPFSSSTFSCGASAGFRCTATGNSSGQPLRADFTLTKT